MDKLSNTVFGRNKVVVTLWQVTMPAMVLRHMYSSLQWCCGVAHCNGVEVWVITSFVPHSSLLGKWSSPILALTGAKGRGPRVVLAEHK